MIHSPGPFRAEGGAIKALSHGTWYTLALVDKARLSLEGRAGNAVFLAHAATCHEELLEALKTAQVRIFMLEGDSDEYEKARAAIAKAEGRG